ncbi:tripartite tricarboxylate transporter substrate-binding protein [Tautonia marina]|uniref:tripartite tricarboxylate transporter substrate-binding protein n=1 Tax=Tautonia marina TaxID=2653855 RepID=UPI001260ACF2|nr:tripartite tricarboxylate transporter substrate-binding protein [Tautonia marina]
MIRFMDLRSRLPFLLLGLLVLVGCSEGERYPDRPMMLICPWSAGGGTDTVSRTVAALLEQELGVPVNVVNATGGSGVTGHTRGALAPADGYTLTMVTVELNMLHWRGLTNITPDDFRPLMLLNRDDAALFVRDDAPWQTLAELKDAVAAEPRALRASGTAQGGIWHVSLAGWLNDEGLDAGDILWIPINGAGPSLDALMSGGVEMVCCSLPEASALLESGRIRCLGVMSADRVQGFLDVPTFREEGSDWTMGGWRGLALPLGVPEDRAELLESAVAKVIQSESYLEFMENTGFNVSPAPPEAFRAIMDEFDRQMGVILTGDAFQSVRSTRYGPMIFPGILLGLLALVLLILAVRGGLRRSVEAPRIDRDGLVRMGVALAFVLGYVLLADRVGYVLTAMVLLLGMLCFLRVKWPVALAVALVCAPMTYQVFAVVLRVPLPWGWLGW